MTYEISFNPRLLAKLDDLCDRRAKRGEARPKREELLADLIEIEHARWFPRTADHDNEAPKRVTLGHDMPVACAACHKPMVTGQTILMMVLGPGDDEEERERCRSGRPYTALTVPTHFACVTGREP